MGRNLVPREPLSVPLWVGGGGTPQSHCFCPKGFTHCPPEMLAGLHLHLPPALTCPLCTRGNQCSEGTQGSCSSPKEANTWVGPWPGSARRHGEEDTLRMS